MSKEYSYRGRGPAGVPASVAAAELSRIEKRDGKIDPAVVVEEAHRPRSPLHDAFEWDDAEAAHGYRLWQARNLIRAVIVTDGDEEGPVFVNVPIIEDEPGGYVTAATITDAEIFESAQAQFLRKIDELMHSLEYLTRVAPAARQRRKLKAVGHLITQARETLS